MKRGFVSYIYPSAWGGNDWLVGCEWKGLFGRTIRGIIGHHFCGVTKRAATRAAKEFAEKNNGRYEGERKDDPTDNY